MICTIKSCRRHLQNKQKMAVRAGAILESHVKRLPPGGAWQVASSKRLRRCPGADHVTGP